MRGISEVRTTTENPKKTQGKLTELQVTNQSATDLLEQILEQVQITNYFISQIIGDDLDEPESLR